VEVDPPTITALKNPNVLGISSTENVGSQRVEAASSFAGIEHQIAKREGQEPKVLNAELIGKSLHIPRESGSGTAGGYGEMTSVPVVFG